MSTFFKSGFTPTIATVPPGYQPHAPRQSELGDLSAMSVDASGSTSSYGSVNSIVCYDESTTAAAGSGGKVTCLGDADSQVTTVKVLLCRPTTFGGLAVYFR